MMKNDYINELNQIHANTSFKQHLVKEMEKTSSSSIKPVHLLLATSFICACALLIMSFFTFKIDHEISIIKDIMKKNESKLNQLDLDTYMQRNNQSNIYKLANYTNPYKDLGMGENDDYFPARKLSSFDTKDFILLTEENKYQELPVAYQYSYCFTIKEKKDILYDLIDYFDIEDYRFMSNENYLTILSDNYAYEVKDSSVTITINEQIEYKDIDTFINELMQSNPTMFKKNEYEKIVSKFDNLMEVIIILYEENENELEYIGKNEIHIQIDIQDKTTIRVDYSDYYEHIYYPCITYKQALKQLQNNQYYYQQGMKDYIDVNQIYCAKLTYMFDIGSNSWLPYYQFYVGVKNLDLAQERGFIIEEDDEYVLDVLVEAISEKYIKHTNDYEIDMIGGMMP